MHDHQAESTDVDTGAEHRGGEDSVRRSRVFFLEATQQSRQSLGVYAAGDFDRVVELTSVRVLERHSLGNVLAPQAGHAGQDTDRVEVADRGPVGVKLFVGAPCSLQLPKSL